MADTQDFGVLLAQKLTDLGLVTQNEFAIPLSLFPEKKFRVDIYIKSPVRAFVEIFSPNVRQQVETLVNHEALTRQLESCAKRMSVISRSFGGAIVPVVVTAITLKPEEKLLFNYAGLDAVFAVAPAIFTNEGGARAAAKQIKMQLIKSHFGTKFGLEEKIQNVEYLKPLDGVGEFGDVLISLRPLMSTEHFKLIFDELVEFNAEFSSDHFTSAALRIGRTLELIIYVLAQSWNVEIDKIIFKRIDDLQISLNQLKTELISFRHLDGELKEKQRQKVQEKAGLLQKKVMDLAFNVDEEPTVSDEKIPVNIPAILRDARKKYARHEETRSELDELINGDLILSLLELRNRSAHANIALKSMGINKNDVQKMSQNLRAIIFKLCNVSNSIAKFG